MHRCAARHLSNLDGQADSRSGYMPSHVDSVRCSCDAIKKKPQPATVDNRVCASGAWQTGLRLVRQQHSMAWHDSDACAGGRVCRRRTCPMRGVDDVHEVAHHRGGQQRHHQVVLQHPEEQQHAVHTQLQYTCRCIRTPRTVTTLLLSFIDALNPTKMRTHFDQGQSCCLSRLRAPGVEASAVTRSGHCWTQSRAARWPPQ